MIGNIKNHQAGVALLSVLMMLVLLSTLAIYAAEEQDISIRKVSNIKEAEQAFQISIGGEQWAVKLLEKDLDTDQKQATPDYDHVNENWANLGPAIKVEGTESFMQVLVFDEQGKFNLNNLIQGKDGNQSSENNGQEISGIQGSKQNNSNKLSWYVIFQRLLLSLEISPQLADVFVDWIDSDSNTTGTAGAEDLFYSSLEKPYRSANQTFSSLGELSKLRGLSPKIIRKLIPYVTVLPLKSPSEYTRLNVNTVNSQILRTFTDDDNVATELFSPLIESRTQTPFESIDDFVTAFVESTPISLSSGIELFLDVKSDYFSALSCAETGRIKVSQSSLLRKNRTKENVTVQFRKSNYGCSGFAIHHEK